MDALLRIKRLVLGGHVRFTQKAWGELELDGLFPSDITESLLNAKAIYKTLTSSGSFRARREKLYVIKSYSNSGAYIYSKGCIK